MNKSYILRKLFRAIFTVWAVTTFVFVILRLSGDPTTSVLGRDVTTAAVEAFRDKWGLDDPIHIQYLRFIRNIVKGDFGLSILEGRSAMTVILSRLPNTLILMLIYTSLTFIIGISFGLIASLFHNSIKDSVIMMFSIAGFSMPNFILAVILILIFSVKLGWLPSTGNGTPAHYILPILTMTITEAAIFARYTRSAMLEVLYQPYMKTAVAKGLSWKQAIKRHAFKNAAIPIITICGFWIGLIIAGAVVTETIFGWPGIGRLLVYSVKHRDYNVVQGIVILISLSMVITNLAIDFIYGLLDPRISIVRGKK